MMHQRCYPLELVVVFVTLYPTLYFTTTYLRLRPPFHLLVTSTQSSGTTRASMLEKATTQSMARGACRNLDSSNLFNTWQQPAGLLDAWSVEMYRKCYSIFKIAGLMFCDHDHQKSQLIIRSWSQTRPTAQCQSSNNYPRQNHANSPNYNKIAFFPCIIHGSFMGILRTYTRVCKLCASNIQAPENIIIITSLDLQHGSLITFPKEENLGNKTLLWTNGARIKTPQGARTFTSCGVGDGTAVLLSSICVLATLRRVSVVYLSNVCKWIFC